MKNAWLNYILIRVGLFVGVMVILIALGQDKFFSALFAAIISLAISLIFFSKQRDRVSEAVYKRIHRNDTVGSDDADSDHENAVLDAKDE
ncbi:MAG: DUF4229 domain-containing protein [Rhodoluna sp.]